MRAQATRHRRRRSVVVQIGTLNEGALHAQLKEWYRRPGDLLEQVAGTAVPLLQLRVKRALVERPDLHDDAPSAPVPRSLRPHQDRLVCLSQLPGTRSTRVGRLRSARGGQTLGKSWSPPSTT